MRPIAVADLVYYLSGVLNEPRAYAQGYDVGSDELLSIRQLKDTIADVVHGQHPHGLQSAALPVVPAPPTTPGELPPGASEVFTNRLTIDLVGDPRPIRTLLPRSLLSFRQVVEQALATS